jgi:hypothetical protein
LTDVASALSYKINTEYAIGIKWAAYYMSGSGSSSIGFNSGSGIGVKLARSFQYKIFNTINCEYLFIYRITNYTRAYPVLKGGALEVNVGYENKHTAGFVWAIGAVLNSGKTAPLLVLPIIKIGFIVNI